MLVRKDLQTSPFAYSAYFVVKNGNKNLNHHSSFRNSLTRPFLSFLGLSVISVGTGLILVQRPFLLIGLLVFAGFLFIGIHNWRWSLYGLLFYIPFLGIPILAFYPAKFPILLKDFLFVIPAYMGFFVGGIFRGEDRSFPDRLLLGLMICLGFVVVAQLFNPSLANLLVGVIGVKIWLFYMPLTVLTYHLIDSMERLKQLLSWMVVLAFIPVIVTIIEFCLLFFGYNDLVYSALGPGASAATQGFHRFHIGDSILVRVPGIFQFVTQNYQFLFSMIAIGCGTTFLITEKATGKAKEIYLYLFVIISISCVLCGERRAFVTVPLFFLLFFFLQRKAMKIGRLGLVIGISVIIVVSFYDYSHLFNHIVGRTKIAYESEAKEDIIEALKSNPMGLGTGMSSNASRYAYRGQHKMHWLSETTYAKAIHELGIPGLIVLMALFAHILIRGYRSLQRIRSVPLKNFMAALLVFVTIMMIECVKAQPLDWDPINVYFWVFVGIMTRLPYLEKPPEEPENQKAHGI